MIDGEPQKTSPNFSDKVFLAPKANKTLRNSAKQPVSGTAFLMSTNALNLPFYAIKLSEKDYRRIIGLQRILPASDGLSVGFSPNRTRNRHRKQSSFANHDGGTARPRYLLKLTTSLHDTFGLMKIADEGYWKNNACYRRDLATWGEAFCFSNRTSTNASRP